MGLFSFFSNKKNEHKEEVNKEVNVEHPSPQPVQICSTYVNSFRIVTILEDMTASLSSLVHSCQPLSTESAK